MKDNFLERLAKIEDEFNHLKKKPPNSDFVSWATIVWGLEQEETDFIWECYNNEVELKNVRF
jgi:hypothetical protein